MVTKNQVNFFEGGSINKGEMVNVSILGRFPVENFINSQAIVYLARLTI
jgi:hypothetical protein